MVRKVIIAGGRDFDNYPLLIQKCDNVLRNYTARETEIVSGGAKGADILGERYAKERGYALKVFKADWAKYGKAAGPLRNQEMANYADALIAFWDGQSKGTKDMITRATDMGLLVRIIKYP